MPSVSKKQHNLMAAAAHNPAFAKKVGVPVKVAKEFNAADKGKKFSGGGTMATKPMKHDDTAADKKLIKKAVGMHDKQLHGGKATNLSTLKKGGSVKTTAMGKVKTAAPSRDGVAVKGKTKGTAVKMCGGGMSKKGK